MRVSAPRGGREIRRPQSKESILERRSSRGKGLLHNPESFMNKERWPIWPRGSISCGASKNQAEGCGGIKEALVNTGSKSNGCEG